MSHRLKIIVIDGEKEIMKVPKVSASERTWFRFRVRKNFPNESDKLRLKIKGEAWERANEKRIKNG